MEMEDMKKRIPKKWRCMICLREFCYVKGAARHNMKAHQDHARFEDIRRF